MENNIITFNVCFGNARTEKKVLISHLFVSEIIRIYIMSPSTSPMPSIPDNNLWKALTANKKLVGFTSTRMKRFWAENTRNSHWQ